MSNASSASTLFTANKIDQTNDQSSLDNVISRSTGPTSSSAPEADFDDGASSSSSDDDVDLPSLPLIITRLQTMSLDDVKPKSSYSAFLDPAKPVTPQDPRPLWKQQEDNRIKQISRLQISRYSPEAKNAASITGRLVGGCRARPMDMKALAHKHKTPRDANGRAIVITDDHRLVAESIIRTADQGTYDSAVSINEMQVFLKGTEYEAIMEWLTGLKDGNTSRFHELDGDGSSTIEAEELSLAVAEFYSVAGEEAFRIIVEFSKEGLEKRKKAEAVKAEAVKDKRRKTGAEKEARKFRQEQRKFLAAQRLVSGGHEKLNQVRHKILAASYTSFSFGMNFELMFQKFDKDGNGTLDQEELKVRVCEL